MVWVKLWVSLAFLFHRDYIPILPPCPPAAWPSVLDCLPLSCAIRGPWLGWITSLCIVSTHASPAVPPTEFWFPPSLQALSSSPV